MLNQEKFILFKKGRCIMGKPATVGQAYNLLSVIANNTDWESVGTEVLQDMINNPVETGRNFNSFLKNRGRMVVSGFKIATMPFNLKEFLGKDWQEAEEERDERAASFKELDLAKTRSISCLKKDERSIKGEEVLRRLKERKDIRLGANLFMALWQDYQNQSNKNNSILERGVIKDYLYFFGNIFSDPNGDRYVLYLYRRGGSDWRWSVGWLGGDWLDCRLSLVLPQVSS